ncbi:MAG: hypothetical protein ABI743_02150 [bacterium]
MSTSFSSRPAWGRLLVIAVATSLALSCSSSDNSPETPASAPANQAVVAAPTVTPEWQTGNLSGGTGVLGMYAMEIAGGATPHAELQPLRLATAVGDNFDVDISDFLSASPCRDCLEITGLSLDPGNLLQVDFVMSHPFTSLAARKDLHVFDTRLTVIGEPEAPVTLAGIAVGINGGTSAVTNPGFVANADGYTSFFDGALEAYLVAHNLYAGDTGTIKPYKLLWEDTSSTNYNAGAATGWGNVDAPQGENVFPQAGTKSDPRADARLTFALDPSWGAVRVLLVADTSYGQSAVKTTRMTPKYFLPLFHRHEPWKVGLEVTNNLLSAGVTSSTATIDVDAWDWQGSRAATTGFDPNSSPLDAIPASSNVRDVTLAVPGVMASPQTQTVAIATGTGAPSDPYHWSFLISNSAAAAVGDFTAIVRVTDELEGSNNGPTPLNRDLSTPAFKDLATYQTITIPVVGVANLPPVAVLLASDTTPDTGQSVNYSPGAGTLDPDGSIALYEYDWDYDPLTPLVFTTDASNTTGVAIAHVYTNAGPGNSTKTPALRVTDNGAPALTAIDYETVVVAPPSALPIWDFENASDTLPSLGFTLLGTNGYEVGPTAPCNTSHAVSGFSNTYTVPAAGSTWGLVAGIGDPAYAGNTTNRALDETGSTAGAGVDQRYFGDALYAIRTPAITLPATAQNYYVDLHHWFQTDLDYWVDLYLLAGIIPVNPPATPGRTFLYDGATVWIRSAPGGVPTGAATRLDVIPAQQTEPFWTTFDDSIGIKLVAGGGGYNSTTVYPWNKTQYAIGVDKGFAGVSYNASVSDHKAVVFDAAVLGKWKVNPAAPTFIDSRLVIPPAFEGQQVVLEFRFASKKGTNIASCNNLFGPPCIECLQNLEALTSSGINYRISKGWKLDRIAVVEAP